MGDLLVVAPATDPLARDLAERGRSAGIEVEVVSHDAAAGLFTLSRRAGVDRVSPDRPIFLRLPAGLPPGTPDDRQFHDAERRAIVWAAAALTSAPVVNRPGVHGFQGRVWPSTAVLRRRAGLPGSGTEVFTCCPRHAGSALKGDDWWLEHLGTYQVSPAASAPPCGPFRAGRLTGQPRVALACVVGSDVLLSPGLPVSLVQRMEEDSRRICQALGVTFATIPWHEATESAEPQPGRVN